MKIFNKPYIYQLYEVLTHLDYLDCIKILQLNSQTAKLIYNRLINDLIVKKQQQYTKERVNSILQKEKNPINRLCGAGNYYLVTELINRGYRCDITDLLEAVYYNRIQIVLLLIDYCKIDPTLSDNEALKVSIIKGYIVIFEKLMEDPRVLVKINWQSMFNLACQSGQYETVNSFIDVVDNFGNQPFRRELKYLNPKLNYKQTLQQRIYIIPEIKKRIYQEIKIDLVKYKKELIRANRFNDIERIKSLLLVSENDEPILMFKLKKVINEILEWSIENSLTFVLLELMRNFKFKSKQIKLLRKRGLFDNHR